MKKSKPLFLLGFTVFLLCTGVSNSSAGKWALKSDDEKKIFFKKIFTKPRLNPLKLMIGGARNDEFRGWTFDQNAITVNIASAAGAEFLADGLDAKSLTDNLAPLFQKMTEDPELRFDNITYKHVLYAGSNKETSDKDIEAFQVLMPLLAPGGSFIYMSHMNTIAPLLNEPENEEIQRLTNEKYRLEGLTKGIVKRLKKIGWLNSPISTTTLLKYGKLNKQEKERAKKIYDEVLSIDIDDQNFVKKYERKITLLSELLPLLKNKSARSFSTLAVSWLLYTTQTDLIYKKVTIALKSASPYAHSKLPALFLEEGESRPVDFSKEEDRQYFQRTNFDEFLKKMKSDLPLDDIKFSLEALRNLSFCYKITGIKKEEKRSMFTGWSCSIL